MIVLKGSTVLLIVGGIAVLGVVSYSIHKAIHDKERIVYDYDYEEDSNLSDNGLSSIKDAEYTSQPYVVLGKQKSEAVQSVGERHHQASEMFKKTVDEIMSDDNREVKPVTENSDDFEKISDNLDDLLN